MIAQERMAPNPRAVLPQYQDTPPKEAGVLALLFREDDTHPVADAAGQWHITLTRRTDTLRGHSGQISFPGGKRDPEDDSFIATALRETCEELGMCESIEVLGQLSPFYIPPSHYNVYPSVGVVRHKPQFQPNPQEVAEVFYFPVHDLLNETFKHTETREFYGKPIRIPYYLVCGHKVWGATAVMLSELEHRLRQVL